MTQPRCDLLVLLESLGGSYCHERGRVRASLATALGYDGTRTGLNRVIAALTDAGYISTETGNGRIYKIELTTVGSDLLYERGLASSKPRTHLIPADDRITRDVLVLTAETIGQQVITWARETDLDRDPEQIRLDWAMAMHQDLTPKLPEAGEFATEVAQTRAALSRLLDRYLTQPGELEAEIVDHALIRILDIRRTLIAMRSAIAQHTDEDRES